MMPGTPQVCPTCGAVVSAPLVRGEGEWNQGWRVGVPAGQQFRPYPEGLIADVVAKDGTVVEQQQGPIPRFRIHQCERVYGPMAWLFNETTAHADQRLVVATSPGRPLVRYRWFQARETIEACTRPVYLDLGPSPVADGLHMLLLAQVRRQPKPKWLEGSGQLYTAAAFHSWVVHGFALTPWVPEVQRTRRRAA
ncbi:hypothetical protein AB0953_02690 [Streptomyces sp. NPDC046866]|uniref:hypothetical protein n=1 Tax=Streptomyces sp. NPDC046866 TaxID=3154921 RepID=UPI0034566582